MLGYPYPAVDWRRTRRGARVLGFAVLLGIVVLMSAPIRLRAETDPAHGRAISIQGVTINARTHIVYAVDAPGDALVIQPEAGGPARRIHVGHAPIAVAVNARTNRVYVVNKMSDSVTVVNGATASVMATIPLPHGAHPYLIAVNEATNRIYVANTYSNTLTVIDGENNRAVEVPAGNADGMVLDPVTGSIFLISYEGHEIRAVHPQSASIERVPLSIAGRGTPRADAWGIALAPTSQALLVGLPQADAVAILNLRSRRITRLAVGAIPCAIAVDTAAHRAYVVNYGSRTVSVINTRTDTVLATLPVGSHPQAIAVDAVRHRAYVANVHGDSVTVIDTLSNAVLATQPAGKHPYALALDPVTGRLFAATMSPRAVVAVPLPGSRPTPAR